MAMHVLLTPYWAFGFLGRQKPKSFPETRGLSPVAMRTWRPSRSPLNRNMDSDTLQVFQSELTCSICMNCFLDPVTIDCGHSFCRPCLSLCWEEGQTPRRCPECRGISERPDFKTNIALKRLASLARQAKADHDHSSEEQICEKLLKRMSSLWKMREEIQISLNQEDNITKSFEGLENVLEMTHLAQIQKPQPVNPELPSWPVSGFLHMLNNFR
ncbi:PREDICTED: tripartite motif-containing protein 64-like, partial [Bison bison bison]|uniref:Tripartite motif-containing protein 64-like n=1 Tax=Bison bison bison TaxID=43346 RepID=A0A6P3GJD1_BISBB